MTERLTTLTAVKDWLSITSDQDDRLVRLIDAASQFTINFLNRETLLPTEYTQNFKGNGKDSQLLRNWPVIEVISVGIADKLIPASVISSAGMPSSGYRLSDPRSSQRAVELVGYYYTYGQPCQVVYKAGFVTTESTTVQVLDSTAAAVWSPVKGHWTSEVAITIDGLDGIKEGSSSGLEAGHYYVDDWGSYSFSPADVDKEVVLTYSYVPWDLSNGVLELIGEWYRRKDRIGILSKSLGGQESVTFSSKDFNDTIHRALVPYTNVVPV